MLARVRVGVGSGEGAVIGHNHLLGEARALGDGLLQGSAANPFPGSLVEWPLIGRDVRLTGAALEVARRANALPGRAGGVHRNAVMLGAAQTLCHFFSRERLEVDAREEALELMVEALRQNRLGDLAEAFWDHHQAPTQQRGFEVPAETLEEIRKLEAVLGDYHRASGRDRAGHLDGLMPLYEPLFRQLWFLRAIPGSGASAHLSRLRAMMPVEVRQSGALFEVGRRPEGALDARSAWSSERGVWTGTRLDPVRGDYDLLPVGTP